MANYECVDTVRALIPAEVNRLTAVQLKCALKTILANQQDTNGPTNAVLLEELQHIRQELATINEMKKEIGSLQLRLDDAYKIINQQNWFLESLDAKERVRNIVITGVKEEEDNLGRNDSGKVKSVLEAAGYTNPFNVNRWVIKRLGKPNDRRKRPIHIALESQDERNKILQVAKNLKDKGGDFARVYLKKDIHPASRKEMMRLKNREREEKQKTDNQGVDIRYDWHNRVLLRDGVVIDRYFPNFAMGGGGQRQN